MAAGDSASLSEVSYRPIPPPQIPVLIGGVLSARDAAYSDAGWIPHALHMVDRSGGRLQYWRAFLKGPSCFLSDMQKFKRTIEIDVEVEGRELRSSSRMTDEYHDMTFSLTLDLGEHRIRDCSASMNRFPYRPCQAAVDSLRQAVGLEVGLGIKKRFRAAVPRAEGCAHITELADNTFDYLMQKLFWDGVGREDLNREQLEAMTLQFLNQSDACKVFNKQTRFQPGPHDFLPEPPSNGDD